MLRSARVGDSVASGVGASRKDEKRMSRLGEVATFTTFTIRKLGGTETQDTVQDDQSS